MINKLLRNMLLGVVLGSGSFSAWAQCAQGGEVGTGGFCYYRDGSCPTHQPYDIPGYCKKGGQAGPDVQAQPNKPTSESTFPKFNPPKFGPVEVHYFGVVGRDDAAGNDVVREGGDLRVVQQEIMKACPNCHFIFYWSDSCAGQAKAKQASGKLKAYYASAPNAGQAKQKALSACKTENAKGCYVIGADCRALNP